MWHYLIFQFCMLLSALACNSYIYITNLHVITCMSYMSYMVYIYRLNACNYLHVRQQYINCILNACYLSNELATHFPQ